MNDELDPLPTRPWNADVKIWREHGVRDTSGLVGASIPHTVIWHSPDGFNFGYEGSGAADLALNILNAFVPPGPEIDAENEEEYMDRDDAPQKCFRGTCSRFAARYHQQFKREFIAPMCDPGATISAATVVAWIDARRRPGRRNEVNRPMIDFTREKRDALRREYDKAVAAKQENFKFEGNEYVVAYAKYLLEYLDGKFGR
jgi:hypothetical protein